MGGEGVSGTCMIVGPPTWVKPPGFRNVISIHYDTEKPTTDPECGPINPSLPLCLSLGTSLAYLFCIDRPLFTGGGKFTEFSSAAFMDIEMHNQHNDIDLKMLSSSL